MRVTCPNCDSKFKVPDKALGTKGRKLKCAKCEHQWFQEPPSKADSEGGEKPAAKKPAKAKSDADATEEAPPGDETASDADAPSNDAPDGDSVSAEDGGGPEAVENAADDLSPPPLGGVRRFRPRGAEDRKPKPVALYILLGCAVLIPVILLVGRTSLVESWPPSALLYDSIGLHVPVAGEGLVLRNVYAQKRQEGTLEVLVVAGEIQNPSDLVISLPALQGSVLDADGTELQSWLFTADAQLLPPGETISFTSEFAAQDATAAQVNVSFTKERPTTGLGY